MKAQETVQKFIEPRAQGWTCVRLMAELNVSKPYQGLNRGKQKVKKR
jgi:hypothetical protein